MFHTQYLKSTLNRYHSHIYTSDIKQISFLFRVLVDPLAPLVPLVRMVLVVSVVILVPLVPLESRVLLDHLVKLERRDTRESLVPL